MVSKNQNYQGKVYRGPSLGALVNDLRLTREKALEVRGLIKGKINPDTYEAVQSWEKRCFNRPNRIERLLCALNEALGTYGTEALYSRHLGGGYWQGARFIYLNAGDTYAPTLVYDTELDYFRACCWGDLVESPSYGLE